MINLTNYFLVASPTAPRECIYSRSVVYITEHAETNGAVGVIINRPIGKTVNQIFNNMNIRRNNRQLTQNQLFWGGPLSSENGYVLHKVNNNHEQLFELTNNKGVLIEMIEDRNCNEIFISLGYCGWMQSQLEEDIKLGNWLVIPARNGIIFEVDPIDRYEESLHILGIRNIYQLLSAPNLATCFV